jgi:uncharacterized SAM-binding protein YcdF (DUF218 family)
MQVFVARPIVFCGLRNLRADWSGLRRRKLLLTSLILLAICAAPYAVRDRWLPWLGAGLVAAEKPQKAEIIVVLGGDLRGARIMVASELIHQGWAPQALISGAGYIYGYHESDLEVDYAVRHGESPDEFVRFPFPATSTRDEARAVVGELRRRHVHKYLVVTSNYHTRRAARIFRDEGPELEPHVVSSGDANFHVENWWRNREGRKILLDEYMKTVGNAVGL